MLDEGNIDPEIDYQDIEEALSSLSEADLLRLDKAAIHYSFPSRYTPKDLLQQTFSKVLDGSRSYKKGINILAFLIKTMQSLASSDCKSQKRKPECRLDPERPGNPDVTQDNSSDIGQSPEDILIANDSAAHIKGKILKLFDDRLEARMVMEAIMEGMNRTEIQELTDLDDKNYDSTRRLIRRRLEKAFPEGWKDE
jgi:RNA polymerase sigma-70 factor (ECF subfamily)